MKRILYRRISILVSIMLLLISIILQCFYRPYIYHNHIFDFHIADTFTSWLCVPCGTCLLWGLHKTGRFVKILLSSFVGFLLYEFVGLTFDWYDIIALSVSTGITYVFYIICKRYVL